MESEQSIAREDREGSAPVREFMAFVSSVGEVFWTFKNPESDFLDSH
jgi:hypothetical protein